MRNPPRSIRRSYENYKESFRLILVNVYKYRKSIDLMVKKLNVIIPKQLGARLLFVLSTIIKKASNIIYNERKINLI